MATFSKDLIQGKRGEDIVKNVLFSLTTGYKIEDISDEPKYYYTGDLRITTPEGKAYYLEIKNDTRIHETKNVLLEEEVYFNETDEFRKGNMYCNSDIYVVVSETDRKIYFFDFNKLKKNYKKGVFECIKHAKQTTYAYLCNIATIEKK